jgi:hypothetical protein
MAEQREKKGFGRETATKISVIIPSPPNIKRMKSAMFSSQKILSEAM